MERENTIAPNDFDTMVNSPTYFDFQTDEALPLYCPMCGAETFSGYTCSSCQYVLGSGIGVDPSLYSLPLGEGWSILLVGLLFYLWWGKGLFKRKAE